MRGVAFWFLLSAVIYVTLGMLWGIEMAVRQNFEMAPAHAHLNLLGWVTLALFGLYYHVVPAAAATGLARLHFALATLGVWTMPAGIAITIRTHGELLVAIGALLTLASMLIFLATVVRFRSVRTGGDI
ncbi:MAG: hypothetical protein Q8Q26_04040 [Pseudorhodobacter sp.]|nr:hypothetical protein [Pseudorhodobacter sp.]